MELYVNGQKLDITLENEKTVGQVLSAFEEEAAKSSATTIEIKLNDKAIKPEEFETITDIPLEENTKIELSVISVQDLNEAFKYHTQKFSELAEKLEEIPVYLQGGKEKDAHLLIAVLAEEINSFCHTTTLSALFPENYGKILIENKDIGTFFKEFSEILNDFEDALVNKDTVTVGDLCEYEISPRLTQISQSINELLK